MTEVRAVAAFLADCWRADSRGGDVVDLLGAGVEHLRVFERDPFLGFSTVRVALHNDDPLVVAAELTRREKAPFLFALALIGRGAQGRRRERIAAPLLVWPARVERYADGTSALVAESERPRINAGALADLLGEERDGNELAAELARHLPAFPWGPGGGFAFATALESLPGLAGIRVASLAAFPDQLESLEVIEKYRSAQRPGDAPRLIASIGLGLARRSLDTRGVDDELRRLCEAPQLSSPVQVVLGEGGSSARAGSVRAGAERRGRRARRSPAVLSRPQVRALEIASTATLGLLVGPPGTGKSFTIAAIALDAIARGESVLIASGREQAVSVVEDKCRELAGGWLVAVRAGRGEVGRELAAGIDALLHGDLGAYGPPSQLSARQLERGVAQRERRAGRLERRLRHQLTVEAGSGPQARWVGRFKNVWSRLATLGAPPVWEGFRRWEGELRELGPAVAEWLRVSRRERIEVILAKRREALVTLRRALGARRSGDQERWFGQLDRDVMRAAFPLWSTTFADAHRALPFEPGFFDLVIIDEATQCDSASALPILQRGNRVLVTGDPQQLRHVSFLSDAVQRELGRRHGLDSQALERYDYRRRSLLDLVADALPSSDAIARLDEHFRSAPAIIEFSNQQFYGGGLAVMTRRPSSLAQPSLQVRRVSGARTEDGVNLVEIEEVIEVLARLSVAEAPHPLSFGVVSPFRAQADALAAACAARLGAGLVARHNLLVATVWGFQGEERDVMIVSLALDPTSPAGSWRYLQREDLFNVAITRARQLQVVVTSVAPGEEPPGSLVASYLEFAEKSAAGTRDTPKGSESELAHEVAAACRQHGWQVWPQFEVAGTTVDLLVAHDGVELAVDLIGGSSADGEALEIERARMLGRAGLRLFPLPWSSWSRDPVAVLDALGSWLGVGRGRAAGKGRGEGVY